MYTPSGAGSILFVFILTRILCRVSRITQITGVGRRRGERTPCLAAGLEDFYPEMALWIPADVKGKEQTLADESPELGCLTLSAVSPRSLLPPLPAFADFRDGSHAQLEHDNALPWIAHNALVDACLQRLDPADGQPSCAWRAAPAPGV